MVLKTLALLVTSGVLLGAQVQAGDPRASIGPGQGILTQSGQGHDCGSLLMNSNGIYNGAYAWQYDGVVPPYYGAFAERYAPASLVCGLVLDLTNLGYHHGQMLDAYIWTDDAGIPGEVLCFLPGVDPGPIATWPDVSRHHIQLPAPCPTGENWWIGYWGDWPGENPGWAIGASYSEPLDGFPFTNIAPGLGPDYPTGWHDVSIIWGPTEALGIGAEVNPLPSPVEMTSWGRIKETLGR